MFLALQRSLWYVRILIVVPFSGFRIISELYIYIYLVKPKKGTTMETIGAWDKVCQYVIHSAEHGFVTLSSYMLVRKLHTHFLIFPGWH